MRYQIQKGEHTNHNKHKLKVLHLPFSHFHSNASLVLQLCSKSYNHPSKECVLYFSDNRVYRDQFSIFETEITTNYSKTLFRDRDQKCQSLVFQTKANTFRVSFSRQITKFSKSHFWDRDQNFSQKSNDWNNFIALILTRPKFTFQDETMEW